MKELVNELEKSLNHTIYCMDKILNESDPNRWNGETWKLCGSYYSELQDLETNVISLLKGKVFQDEEYLEEEKLEEEILESQLKQFWENRRRKV